MTDLRVGDLVVDVDGASLSADGILLPDSEGQVANITQAKNIECEGENEDKDIPRVVNIWPKKEKEIVAAMDEPRDKEHRGHHYSEGEMC
jgi:hypothetical protein